MKKTILFSGIAVFLVCGVLFAQTVSSKKYIIDSAIGKVQVSHDGGKRWGNAEADMELVESDIIKTGSDASCEVMMPDRGLFKIVQKSQVQIRLLNGKNARLQVSQGKVVVSVKKKLAKDESFKIETMVAVAAVRGTEFSIEVSEDQITGACDEGKVALTRNVALPADVEKDPEIAKLLEVEITANQALDMTMDENRHLEDLINRAKSNLQELKQILASSQADTQKKVRLARNAQRIIDQLNEDNEEEDAVDTSKYRNKMKQ